MGTEASEHLGAEEVVEEGGHDDGRLLLGDADVPAELLRAVQAPRRLVPARSHAALKTFIIATLAIPLGVAWGTALRHDDRQVAAGHCR